MKTKVIITIALLTILGACNNNQPALTILSGSLPDLKNETLFLVPADEFFPGLLIEDTYPTLRTDSLGRYQFRFTATNSNFYQIINNKYHRLNADIYLEPGDSLWIEQSSWSDQSKFVITGKGSDKLKHLEKDYSIFPKDKAFYDKINSNQFATELDFKHFIDSIHFQRVHALAAQKNIPDLVKKHHLNTLNAERAEFLLNHLEYRNYYMKQESDYFFPADPYYSFLDSMNFDTDFSKTTAAKQLAYNYLNNQYWQANKSKAGEEWWNENMNWKFEFISNQPKSLWTDLLSLSTISDYSFGLMTDHFFNDLEVFDNNISPKFFSKKNQSLFAVNLKPFKNLAPGNPAPDFELPDSNGKLHRLSNFKGRIVYIDFWGTWCGPCKQEIPDALIMQEKYKDKPVTFLYVALEYDSTDITQWKEFISGKNKESRQILNNKPFPGVHLVAEKQFHNESISAYRLNFAPTHVLIDQNGNIVQPRAKRSKEIQQDIDQLLMSTKEL